MHVVRAFSYLSCLKKNLESICCPSYEINKDLCKHSYQGQKTWVLLASSITSDGKVGQSQHNQLGRSEENNAGILHTSVGIMDCRCIRVVRTSFCMKSLGCVRLISDC